MKLIVRKAIFIFVIFLVAVSVFGAIIALMAQYFRANETYTPFVKLILVAVMALGMYKAWKWFCYRLDKLDDK